MGGKREGRAWPTLRIYFSFAFPLSLPLSYSFLADWGGREGEAPYDGRAQNWGNHVKIPSPLLRRFGPHVAGQYN